MFNNQLEVHEILFMNHFEHKIFNSGHLCEGKTHRDNYHLFRGIKLFLRVNKKSILSQ